MDDKQIEGGAGPALAAHSKDASVPGGNPASSATGHDDKRPGAAASDVSDTVSRVAGQARDAAGKVAASVSNAAGQVRDQVSGQGGATDQVAEFVREKPIAALLATGAVGLILGMLLTRR